MHPKDISRIVDAHVPLGLCIDTNLIALLVVGTISRWSVPRHRRTSKYSIADYDLLLTFVSPFKRYVTTPNVLTEASNILSGHEERLALRELCIQRWEELPVSSLDAAITPYYAPLGLTDSAILSKVCGSFLLLTDDGPLAAAVLGLHGGAVLFDWLRAAEGR